MKHAVLRRRLKLMLEAHFPAAVAGDDRSAVVCCRVLAVQARIVGLNGAEPR